MKFVFFEWRSQEKHSAELDEHSLYDGLELVNDVEVIAQVALEAEA